jgi:L-rhamnose mutarotase
MFDWNLQAAGAEKYDFLGICRYSIYLQKKQKKVPHYEEYCGSDASEVEFKVRSQESKYRW